MEKSIICEGKTSNEAIQKGLKELGCKLEDVEVKVLEDKEKKVFFSILDPRVVKVELTLKNVGSKETKVKEIKDISNEDFETFKLNVDKFLDIFCKVYGNITYKIEEEDNKIVKVIIDGEDSSKINRL